MGGKGCGGWTEVKVSEERGGAPGYPHLWPVVRRGWWWWAPDPAHNNKPLHILPAGPEFTAGCLKAGSPSHHQSPPIRTL